MALNSNATLIVNTGHFYTAAVGTALPADLLAPGAAWTEVGHTSIEDIFGVTSEGGEATVIGTLQAGTLRQRFASRSELFTFTLQQFDEASLKLYFGANSAVVGDNGAGGLKHVQVPSAPDPTDAAFLAVFQDGTNEFAFYAPKAELFRNDDMSLSDTESLAGLPLGVRPLQYNTNNWNYAVTPLA